MKFNFNVSNEFMTGIKRLSTILGFEFGCGITVTAKYGKKLGVTLKNDTAVIFYTKKHLFFRQLGILVHKSKTSDNFELFEDTFFEEMSILLDTACGGVPTVKTIEKFLDYSVLMGYGIGMIYIEDGLELENYKYFGHLRGRYTKAELHEVDDYAFDYGIEMIPCIECYGHLRQYLSWKEARSVKDTDTVLLARSEDTYLFAEEIIKTASECMRSKRIHIGMDEAWDMGRGKFMDKYGYVPAWQIFSEVINELVKITDKYDLYPMMWIDMYFSNSNPNRKYLVKDISFTDELKATVPSKMQLVYWNYDYMQNDGVYYLEKAKELGREVIFAGCSQGYTGHFPDNNFSLITAKDSLESCRKTGVNKVMQTVWSNDGNECELFANLIGMSHFAEFCFDKGADADKLKERFFAVTGESFNAFMLMGNYFNDFDIEQKKQKGYISIGKSLFWQDILEGLYDKFLFDNPMSDYYKTTANALRQCKGNNFYYLIDFAIKIFDYLSVKTKVAEELVPAYKAGDKETLFDVKDNLLPKLYQLTDAVCKTHKKIWDKNYKPTGWITLDIRYAGVKARINTAIDTLEKYLSGELDSIYELEQPRLDKEIETRYSRISNVYFR